MQYIAYVTGSPDSSGDFKSGNWRGEPRWERNVADALHTHGRLLGVTIPGWKGVPTWDTLPESAEAGVVIAHGADAYAFFDAPGRHYINNYYSPPHAAAQKVIRDQMAAIGPENVLMTAAYQSSGQYRQLRALFPKNFAWLPAPAVPAVYPGHDAWKTGTTLLWANRTFLQVTDCFPGAAAKLFQWVAQKLRQNDALMFEVLTGSHAEEAEKLEADMWSRPYFAVLAEFRDRVVFLKGMHWWEVDAVWKRTRMVVNSPMGYGGPPFEAAAYGIPTIGYPTTSPFHDENEKPHFREYIGCEAQSPDFVPMLERLYSDHAYFRRAGDVYRDWTAKYNTYTGFVAYLDQLSEKLGWH